MASSWQEGYNHWPLPSCDPPMAPEFFSKKSGLRAGSASVPAVDPNMVFPKK
jgi:hypothetical protein